MYFYRKLPISLVASPPTATIVGSGNSTFFSVEAINLDPGEGLTANVTSNNPSFVPSPPTLIFFGDPPTSGFSVSFSGFSSSTATITISGGGAQTQVSVTGSAGGPPPGGGGGGPPGGPP